MLQTEMNNLLLSEKHWTWMKIIIPFTWSPFHGKWMQRSNYARYSYIMYKALDIPQTRRNNFRKHTIGSMFVICTIDIRLWSTRLSIPCLKMEMKTEISIHNMKLNIVWGKKKHLARQFSLICLMTLSHIKWKGLG